MKAHSTGNPDPPALSRRALLAAAGAPALGCLLAAPLLSLPVTAQLCARVAFAADALSIEDAPVNYTQDELAGALGILQRMVGSLEEKNSSSELHSYTVSCMLAAFLLLRHDPENYVLQGDIGIGYNALAGSMYASPALSVSLSYRVDAQAYPDYARTLEAAVADALSWQDSSMEDIERCKALHDYLVRNCVYDSATAQGQESTGQQSYSAYGPLVAHTAVCDGYTQAYQLLLARLDIDSHFVASNAMNHSWCMLKLDNSWYHCDVTWDDPVPDQGFDAPVLSRCFLRSDSSMEELDHYGWQTERAIYERIEEGLDLTAPEDYPWEDIYGDISYGAARPAEVPVDDPYIFSDVSYQADYVSDGSLDSLLAAGIISQSTEWLYPQQYLTALQLALMLHRAQSFLQNSIDTSSTDSTEEEAAQACAWCQDTGVLKLVDAGDAAIASMDADSLMDRRLLREEFAASLQAWLDVFASNASKASSTSNNSETFTASYPDPDSAYSAAVFTGSRYEAARNSDVTGDASADTSANNGPDPGIEAIADAIADPVDHASVHPDFEAAVFGWAVAADILRPYNRGGVARIMSASPIRRADATRGFARALMLAQAHS